MWKRVELLSLPPTLTVFRFLGDALEKKESANNNQRKHLSALKQSPTNGIENMS